MGILGSLQLLGEFRGVGKISGGSAGIAVLFGFGFSCACTLLFTLAQNSLNVARKKPVAWGLALVIWTALKFLMSIPAVFYGVSIVSGLAGVLMAAIILYAIFTYFRKPPTSTVKSNVQ